jgi:uncharacterized membrane protein
MLTAFKKEITAMVNIIVITLGIMLAFLAIAIAFLQKLNDRNFKKICALYCEKYKELPPGVSVCYEAGPFTSRTKYIVKMGFIIDPLIYEKPSILSNNKEDVQFMRNLDSKLTKYFKVESFLSNLGILIFIAFWSIVYFCG